MNTVVIRMGDLTQPANGPKEYPVELLFDDGQAGWMTRPLAAITIPEDLSIPDPPTDPVKQKPIDGQQIRVDFLLEGGAGARFEKWGDYLHQLLFQGSLAQEWNRLHALYPREAKGSEGLRTVLDIKPDTLRWLPWELIYKAPLPWFFDSGNPFARGELDPDLPVKTFMWPIHALVVVGSVMNDPNVSAEQEIEAIQSAFIKSPVPIDWHVACRPTKAELDDLITKFKPQILHFIGHGKENTVIIQGKEATSYSFLELTDKNEVAGPEEWTVNDISISLLNWQPRFAFINACRTSSAAAQQNSWDIARAFSNAGVPAVMGMQADVRGDAAAAFSGGFYESLVSGLSIDRSVAEARDAVRNLPALTLRRRDWALATLYLRQLPERILEMQPRIDKTTSTRFNIDTKLEKTRDFVGRRVQRRKIWYGVDQIEDRDEEFSHACIVVGNKEMGKTALVQASMKVCALRDRTVAYVDVGSQSTKNFVDILKIIREGDPKESDIICAPLPTAPFADFDQNYGALLAKSAEAVTALAADEQRRKQFFQAYADALQAIAATKPLIIVLDQLNVEWKDFNDVLVENLLLQIARGKVANCRLILVCSVDDFDKIQSKELKALASVIEVPAWKPEKYVPLARQICLYNGFDLSKAGGLITANSAILPPQWGPTNLRLLVDLLKQSLGVMK